MMTIDMVMADAFSKNVLEELPDTGIGRMLHITEEDVQAFQDKMKDPSACSEAISQVRFHAAHPEILF